MDIDWNREWKNRLNHDPSHLAVILSLLAFCISLFRGLWLPHRLNYDGAFYEHAGWWITRGAVPYVDIWDIKPPLAFALPVVEGLIAGDNATLHYVLSITAMGIVVCATAVATARIIQLETGKWQPALAAGIVLPAFAPWHFVAAHGYRPKILVVGFGITALFYMTWDRYAVAGVLSAVAAGIWQLGAIFYLAILVDSLIQDTGQRRQRGLTVLGAGVVIAALTVLPILAMGGGEAMVYEVIAVQLQSSDHSVTHALFRLPVALGWLIPMAAAGTLGGLWWVGKTPRDRAWLAVVLVGYWIQVLFLDYDQFFDLIPLISVLALGTGVTLAEIDNLARTVGVAWLAVALVISVTALGGIGILGAPLTVTEEHGIDYRYADETPTQAVSAIERAQIIVIETATPVNIEQDSTVSPQQGDSSLRVPVRNWFWTRAKPCQSTIGAGLKQAEQGGPFIQPECWAKYT